MSERRFTKRLRHSVFAKLLAVMLALGFVIPLMVGGFLLYVGPGLGRLIETLMQDHSALLAASGLDLETARRTAARLDLGIRCEGPSGKWSTDESVPEIATLGPAAKDAGRRACGRACYVVTRPDGVTCVFQWRFHQRARAAHDRLLILLLALIVAVVAAAYALLRWILRPLGSLREGVARLSEGDLDVSVGRRTSDEFGDLGEAFDRMVGRVRDMVRSRDRLLLDVSHELRSPLTRIKVALALSEDDAMRRRLEPHVAEMEAMVTELLELERLRDGRALLLEECDLVQIVRDAARAFEDRPPGVVLGEEPAELRVRADPAKVFTVLRNVLDNASKYSLPDSGPVRISIDEGDTTVVVRIEDDGPGIPEKDLDRLFEPFFRVDPSRSRKTGGYGLGLSLCKRIMEAHGGSISARNQSGRGASFSMTFLAERLRPRQDRR